MTVELRPAKPHDARAIAALIGPYASRGILVRKQLIDYFEDIQEFFVAYEGGYIVGCGALHVLWDDIAEVRTEEGKLYLFVAINRTSKFAYAELLLKYGKLEAAQFQLLMST